MEIHLIRHTTVDVKKGICYGQSDVDISDSFVHEATALRLKLDQDYDRIYTSPLSRCSSLANFLQMGNPILDNRLMELNFGDWEMMAWKDIPLTLIEEWHQDVVKFARHNGETLEEMFARVNQLIQYLKGTNDKKVLIVTHAGVIRLFIQHVLEFPLENTMRYPIEYGTIYNLIIDEENKWKWISRII